MGDKARREPGGQPAINQLFRILSSSTRREILRYLDQQHEPVSVTELATVVDSDHDPLHRPREQLITLHHRHLPALEAAGLIEWDRNEQTVENATARNEPVGNAQFSVGNVSVTIADRIRPDTDARTDGETEC